MQVGLKGHRVAILATDGVEQVELVEPRKALDAAGAETHLISPKPGMIQAVNHDEKGDQFPVDRVLSEAHPSDYDALLLPGGVKNPDTLRMDQKAVQFVREFMMAEKPVAAICHGPWLLVEANAVSGRTLTSFPSLQTDIRNAGGQWTNQSVQIDDKADHESQSLRHPGLLGGDREGVREADRRAADRRDERAELSGERSAAEPERDRGTRSRTLAVTVGCGSPSEWRRLRAPGRGCAL
jgi:protease I